MIKKQTLFSIIIATFSFIAFLSCSSSEDDKLANGNKTDVAVTGNVSKIGVTYAIIDGYVNLNLITENYSNPQIGIELSEEQEFKYSKSFITNEMEGNKITITANKLSAQKEYYYRTFVKINNHIYYGKKMDFTTKDITNLISTGEAFDIKRSSAKIKCALINNSIDEKESFRIGIVYSTSKSKICSDSISFADKLYTYDRADNDSIVFTILNLQNSTTYYYCSFTSTEGKYKLGETKEFTTTTISSYSTSERTVMAYIPADNNLSSLSVDDIWEMENGAQNIPTGNTMVLFVDKRYSSEYPFIAKLTGDPNAPLDTLYKYDSERYDSDPAVFKEALQLMMKLCPAKEYGLVLWGYATGWAVDPDTISTQSTRRAYGYDDGNKTWMNITQMAAALNGLPKMKFIFADCCHMACIEVAYELRNTTEYFIGSPAEIPGRGAPYATLIKELFSTSPSFYQNIVDAYYDYYASTSNLSPTEKYTWSYMEDGYSVPLSVINTTYLPQLATATRDLIDNIPNGYPEYPNSPNFKGIAYYFGLDVPMMYDMRAVISRMAYPEQFAEWDMVYHQAVPYSRMSMKWMTVFDGRYVGSQYYYPYFYDLRTDMVSERFDATLPYGCVSMYFPVVGKGYDEGDFCYNLRANNFEWNRLMQWKRFGWMR